MRVAFAGTPEFALPALAALRAHHEVVGVLTQPDRPAGRGRKLSASAVKQAALEAHLPLAQPATLADPQALAQLAAWRPAVLVVVAYGLLLPRTVLDLPPLGCLNIHASLLPRWRGAAPIQRAILAGDAATGVSIMQMDEGLDTGPLLLQRRIALGPDETAGTLHDALAALGAEALIEALAARVAGTLQPQSQSDSGVTYATKISKTEGQIQWTRDAADIARQVRAFNPWPVAETVFEGEPLRILMAHVVMSPDLASKNQDSGAIVGVRDDSLLVSCGHGLLAVTRVQRPGRKSVSARDFSHASDLRGRRFG